MDNKTLENKQAFILLISSLILILLSIIGSFSPFFNAASLTARNLQTASYEFFLKRKADFEFFTGIFETKNKITDLETKNLELESEVARLKSRIEDYRAIEKQNQFDLPYELIPVRVVEYIKNKQGYIYINKGKKEGIKVGQVVVIDNFAVGEIVEVLNGVAEVSLIISPESSIPAITLTNSTKGVVARNELNGLSISQILTAKKINEGELVVTSGINSNFPYGLVLGKVKRVFNIQSELTKTAELSNEIDFNNLSRLFIVK